jgi:hypothetical protein
MPRGFFLSASTKASMKFPEFMYVIVKISDHHCSIASQTEAEGETFLSRIVTADKTWIHHFGPET